MYPRQFNYRDESAGVCISTQCKMKSGGCINIPAEVKHWHGAAPDEWFSHLAIEVPGENGSNEWLEPVSDEEYGKLQ